MKSKITVLGQEYQLLLSDSAENPKLEDSYGYIEPYSKQIVVDKTISTTSDKHTIENIDAFVRKVYRHEILHAFFEESGINYKYSKDEEDFLVDWFAKQFPKIRKIFDELGVAE